MRIILPLILALGAAAPTPPVVSFDPGTNFSHYRSYTWAFAHPPSGIDPTLYRQIHAAVDHSLGAHGFVKSNHGDFAVAFTVGPRDNIHASDYGHYAPYYSKDEVAAHQHWVNQEAAHLATHQHTLAIDIYDASSRNSVWHGIAPVPILPNTRQGIVEHEVDDVLNRFPPKHVCAQAPNGGPQCLR